MKSYDDWKLATPPEYSGEAGPAPVMTLELQRQIRETDARNAAAWRRRMDAALDGYPEGSDV